MTPSKILFYFCLSFILGIFFSSILQATQYPTLIFLIFGVFLISFLKRSKELVVFVFCLLFLLVGIWRHQIAISQIENNQLQNYFGQNITFTGIVDEEPDRREKTTKLTIKVEGLGEKVLITKWPYPEYEYGDKLKITGQLEEPQVFEDFSYKDYLSKEGIFGLLYYPQIELMEKNQGNALKKFLISLKNESQESLNKIMPLPQAAFMEALLFGQEGNISEIWKEKLNITGTRHIAAVSGMNITILTFLLFDFLLSLGFWRQQSLIASIILIFFYILMIGAPSSAVRAGIMACLFIMAQYFGRISTGSRAIVLAATIMLVLNPLLLLSDVGFQLSFLAIMGLIYLQPILSEFFQKIPNTFQLRYNLSGTLSAQIFTLPVLIYNFGQISLISPLTNILILPFLPLATILGFIFSALGIIFATLGQIFSLPAYFLLTYFIKTIDFFSKIPWANLRFQNVSWLFLFNFYLILGIVVWQLNKKQKLKFLQY